MNKVNIILLLILYLTLLPDIRHSAFAAENTGDDSESSETQPEEVAVRISKVKIKGAKAVSKQDIEQSIGTESPSIRFWVKKPEFNEEVLIDDMVRIKRLYASHGYYDAEATYELKYNDDHTRVEITINIKEGEPVILTELSIGYEGDLTDEVKKDIDKAVPLKVDKTFSPVGYQQTKGAIEEILSNEGHPKAVVDGEALVNRREKWARAKFVVKPGPVYTFGSVTVVGNVEVETYVISREATFKKGDIYSLQKINETQANIFQLGLFRSVVIDPVYNEEDQVADVRITVKERKQGSVKFGVGFGTEDKLRAQAIWTKRNFFGGGRRLEVAGKFSFITQRLETSVLQPYILGRDSQLIGSLNFQRDDVPSFEGESFLTTAEVQKDFREYYSAFGSFNVQLSRVQRSARRTPEEKSRENFFLTYFNSGLEMDTTDNILNPTRGFVIAGGLESSFRALFSDVNYFKGTVELRGYKRLLRMILASRLTVGVIQPFGSTGTFDIPIFKRFFAGGSTSMRGFPFQKLGPLSDGGDPLGGNSLLVG
ncbi:MAG: BamA/TamA family outer membrane protein, partial [Candidatus Dadabacteria bacterium]